MVAQRPLTATIGGSTPPSASILDPFPWISPNWFQTNRLRLALKPDFRYTRFVEDSRCTSPAYWCTRCGGCYIHEHKNNPEKSTVRCRDGKVRPRIIDGGEQLSVREHTRR